ncbi:hypothetical protein QQM79_20130 [Marinobacteraceae bacterium S3BR75-40.1]
MDDWQSRLAPVCQKALTEARRTVLEREGCAVTVEDFLLALLDTDTRLTPLLKRWSVDLDELIRTIQCEQSVAPVPIEHDILSAQMVYWLSLAAELHDVEWLTAGQLLDVLSHHAERLQDKAYRAVLELVPSAAWAGLELAGTGLVAPLRAVDSRKDRAQVLTPIDAATPGKTVMAASVTQTARQILAAQREDARPVLWLRSRTPLREQEVLRHLVFLDQDCPEPAVWYRLDWLKLVEARPAMLKRLFDRHRESDAASTVFVLPGCTPAMLSLLLKRTDVLAWRRLLDRAGVRVLLTSTETSVGSATETWVRRYLNRSIRYFDLPLPSVEETCMYLRLEQPRLERQWQLEIADSSLEAAAWLAAQAGSESGHPCASPDQALRLLQYAAAHKRSELESGSERILTLRARQEDLHRKRMTALAREQDIEQVDRDLQGVSLELAAEEAEWYEQTGRNAGLLIREDVIAQAARDQELPVQWPQHKKGAEGGRSTSKASPVH